MAPPADVRTVRAAAPGRLDAFVHATLPALSRRLVRRAIDEGTVRVNDRRARKGTLLRAGDEVTLPALGSGLDPQPEPALPVVHEDAALVALDKPGGMPGHALDPRERGTAANFLVARWPETAAIGDRLAPGLVHRLDTGTSGLLLAARTADVYAALRAAFRARAVEKRYLALVAGTPPAAPVVIDTPLAHDARDRRRMCPAPAGVRAWPAETRIRLVRHAGARALVEATIRTGVTHQVRVHLALAGLPVLGDTLYGGPPAELGTGRHALHAAGLVLAHPVGGARLALESPLPGDLARLVPASAG